MSDLEVIASAVSLALANGGGVIYVKNEAQQLITRQALSRKNAQLNPPLDLTKVAVSINADLATPRYENTL